MLGHSGMLALLCCLLHLHTTTSASLPVPLLTWTTKLQEKPVYVTSGHSEGLEALFKGHVEPSLTAGHLTLVFLQDELSSDDFVKYAESFPHLQKIMETQKNTFFPAVLQGEKSLSELVMDVVPSGDVELVGSSSLNEWTYKGKNVVVFNLEPVAGSSSQGRGDILKRNDHFMHIITKTLKHEGKDFDVVLTSEEPSQLVANFLLNEEIADVTFGSRHLLGANDTTTQNLFNNSCILMYTTSIKLEVDGKVVEFVKPGDVWEDAGGCGSSSVGCSISLTRKSMEPNPANLTGFSLLMDMRNDTQEWHCNNITVTYKTNDSTTIEHFECGSQAPAFESPVYNMIRAPTGMSFACHDLLFTKNTTRLSFGGLQMQTFCDHRLAWVTAFSGAYHCVGFFTIPILTGIFVTVVLMLGLYMGIMMMMAIQVQDRYDDPKGKTISVASAHAD